MSPVGRLYPALCLPAEKLSRWIFLTYFHLEIMAEGRILAQMSSVNESLTNEWIWGGKETMKPCFITSLAWFFSTQCGSIFYQYSLVCGFFYFFLPSLVVRGWAMRESHSQHSAVLTHSKKDKEFSKGGCRAGAYETPLWTWTFAVTMAVWLQTHFSLSFLLLKAGSLNQKRRPKVPHGIILCKQDKQFKLNEALCHYFLATVEWCQKLLLKNSVNLYSVGMSLCEVPIAQVDQHFKKNY